MFLCLPGFLKNTWGQVPKPPFAVSRKNGFDCFRVGIHACLTHIGDDARRSLPLKVKRPRCRSRFPSVCRQESGEKQGEAHLSRAVNRMRMAVRKGGNSPNCKRNMPSEKGKYCGGRGFSATIRATVRVGNSMPTCFSKRKSKVWTVEKADVALTREQSKTRLMREFFRQQENVRAEIPKRHSNGNISQLNGMNREIFAIFPAVDIMFIQHAVRKKDAICFKENLNERISAYFRIGIQKRHPDKVGPTKYPTRFWMPSWRKTPKRVSPRKLWSNTGLCVLARRNHHHRPSGPHQSRTRNHQTHRLQHLRAGL